METQPNQENGQGKRIRFLNVVNEGKRWLSFVVCQTKTADVVIYAWLDDLAGTTHTTIFDLAVEDFGFNEKYEPIGGGAIDTKTCKLQDSLHYGGIDDPKIENAIRNKASCETDY
jgi:hypothetical protein